MSSPTDQQRFRLQAGGVETGGTGKATDYRVDLDRKYDVYLEQGGDRQLIGSCSIEAGPAGTYVVVPEFAINFEPSDCEFWSAWRTDSGGIAHLHNVWMTVSGA